MDTSDIIWDADRSVIIPAGTYYFCDPCYAVKGEEWSDLLDNSRYLTELYAEHDRGVILGFGTAYGDGVYGDQYGNRFPVDAGLIGLVDVRYNDNPSVKDLMVVTFDEPVLCTCRNKNQFLTFGQYEIDTGASGYYDDEE